jgi:hypothetical protein
VISTVRGGCFAQPPRTVFFVMPHRYTKHYTRDEVRALLPQVREWLAQLNQLRSDVDRYDKRLSGMNSEGQDTGGDTVNKWIRALAGMQAILADFQQRQIFIKDLRRGLVDFPAIIGGKEVFLCWESDEDDVEYWHDLESGYSGREKLD